MTWFCAELQPAAEPEDCALFLFGYGGFILTPLRNFMDLTSSITAAASLLVIQSQLDCTVSSPLSSLAFRSPQSGLSLCTQACPLAIPLASLNFVNFVTAGGTCERIVYVRIAPALCLFHISRLLASEASFLLKATARVRGCQSLPGGPAPAPALGPCSEQAVRDAALAVAVHWHIHHTCSLI